MIYKNLAMLTQVGYAIITKSVMQSGVNGFDLMFIRAVISFLLAFTVVKVVGEPIYGPELSGNSNTR